MGLLENALSLRTSAHAGVAIPRIFKHLGRKTKLFPSNRGAATPVTSVTGSQRHTFLTAPRKTITGLLQFENSSGLNQTRSRSETLFSENAEGLRKREIFYDQFGKIQGCIPGLPSLL